MRVQFGTWRKLILVEVRPAAVRFLLVLMIGLSGSFGGAHIAAQQPTSIDRNNYALIMELPYLLNPAAPAASQYLVPGLEVRDYSHGTRQPIDSVERRVRPLDEQGRVIDTFVETVAIRYDRTGRLLEWQTLARDGNGRVLFDETWRFNYDARTAAPLNADVVGAGGQSGVVQFRYDLTGRLTHIAHTDGYAVSREDEIRYLSGRLTERFIRLENAHTEHHRYLYDASGLLRAVRITIDTPVRRHSGWWYWD